jgi:hypothetical protein
MQEPDFYCNRNFKPVPVFDKCVDVSLSNNNDTLMEYMILLIAKTVVLMTDKGMSMEHQWNETDRGKLKYWEKNLS